MLISSSSTVGIAEKKNLCQAITDALDITLAQDQSAGTYFQPVTNLYLSLLVCYDWDLTICLVHHTSPPNVVEGILACDV